MKDSRGFTLIETIIAIGLTTIVLLALARMAQYFYQANASVVEQWQSVEADRTGLERAAFALREASALTSASASALTFTTLASGTTTSVSYTLAGGTLSRAGSLGTSIIARALINTDSTPLFTYYDASGTPLVAPITPSQVASVGISAVVNASPSTNLVNTTLLSGAALRNRPKP
jgi:type II secretory pathway pseudopilin PulG